MNVESSCLLIANAPSSLVNFRLDLIKAIQAKGHQIHVACPSMPANAPERLILQEFGAQVHDIPMNRSGLNPITDIRTCWVLWRLMHRIKPNRILGYTIKPVVWGSLAGFLAGVPQRYALIAGLGYAFVEGDSVSKKRVFVKHTAQLLYRLALNRCQRVFFQNPDDELLFRQSGILKKRIASTVVRGSGVNLDHFQAVSLPEKPAFLLIARLLIDKGVREYAQAAKRLKVQYPEARFMLVGYLDENPESISQVELDSWTSDGYIDYLGKLDDVRLALAQASCFVLPSYREGTPRSVLEALAMGRAVITTDAPGCRETVIDGENGFLVQPKSADDLTRAMEKLIQDPEQIETMGETSLQRAREEFDVHKVNAIMLKNMQF
ncbi:glycosyltransferase family 4 protein [Salinivibrio kushneri]|uniref:glycosyltransferase family 4 protein n=1 Tax=Salinivibrio kushneri TaxID=1908198 RepID=UPI0009897657|nr:glycosyltransferase family 4 protein [Salinivibrio kushneri]OOE63848.1 glycosyltransferase family 1 protein [Salinivibrio kushneri]